MEIPREDFDLPKALYDYRKEQRFSMKKMGSFLGMSTSSYERFENRKRKPTYDEVVRIIDKCKFKVLASDVPSIPNPPTPWYRSPIMTVLSPLLICTAFFSMYFDTISFHKTFGEEYLRKDFTVEATVFCSGIFCVFWWWYFPPKNPFKKKSKKDPENQ